ncbi:hypothetical protein KUTeg_013135 [Tegillarca granosa]|uniref:Uncharacterized protein n=1 Tax=Tegillarca granosa TaxID=220873 RepID=A0ABQ9EWB8_TEGGR|nr:hypothetical protein KUTeg_013135 [Tegillarca granosa]
MLFEEAFRVGYLNRFDPILSFNCQSNEVISGMFSIHSNRHEDRRFKVKCCKVTGRTLKYCYQTPFVNNYDGYLDYFVWPNHYLHGLASQHNNHRDIITPKVIETGDSNLLFAEHSIESSGRYDNISK